ncbi:MAG: sigma-70 family RNA polymerase sigma factor [Proteobacteria bacterium]|nr:sigma-70 family RNA polymerase sigma factor [Pseudomonadota bacterium]
MVVVVKQEIEGSELYLAHRAALIDYAAPIVGDRARAEDVVQEAFLRFLPLTAQRQAVPIAEPVSYLYRIVRNLAYDVIRSRNREERQLDLERGWWMAPAIPRTPENELGHRQDLDLIEAALADLSLQARLAVEMKRFGGYTLQEIANRLGISVASAHRLVRDALTRIASRLPLRDD